MSVPNRRPSKSSSSTSRKNSIALNIPMETGLSTPKNSTKTPKQIQKSIDGFQPIPKKSAIIKTDKPRPHVCVTCTRAFARLEHLKRHERSHTNEKPFQCAACGRCFARRDLVLRHQQKLHSGLSTNNTKEFKKGDNSNIITNYGNKEILLPTENGELIVPPTPATTDSSVTSPSKKQIKPEAVHSNNNPQQQQHQQRGDSISVFNSANTSYATRSSIDDYDEHSTLFKHSENLKTSRQTSISSKDNNEQHHQQHRSIKRQRHNSFSATSVSTYMKNGVEPAQAVHELPEAPHQVEFATPQLSAQEMSSRALMSGIDINALGLQYEELESFDLNRSINQSSTNLTGSTDYFSQIRSPRQQSKSNTHLLGSKVGTPYQFNLTPGGSIMDIPMMSEYLHMGNAGGGAGFSSKEHKVNFNLFNHEPSKSSKASTPQTQTNDTPKISSSGDGKQNNSTLTSNSIHDDSSSPEDWLEEFINTPFESNFSGSAKNFNTIGFLPSISPSSSSNHSTTPKPTTTNPSSIPMKRANSNASIKQDYQSPSNAFTPGFLTNSSIQSPLNSYQSLNNLSGSSNDIPTLFRSRQIDLFHNEVEQNDVIKTTTLLLFTKELRDDILRLNNLSDSQFPSLDELNQYATLFKNEFDKYFPFIHLPTLKPGLDNYPLLLSIASVGALYGFHSTHAMLMFNITRYRIHEYLEREKKSFKNNNSIPVWIYQSMVLLIFIGIFNNDLSITKTMTIFLNSLIELVKLTSLNLPLENFLTPPPIMGNLQNSSESIQEQNFNYFILAQTRIRTCHTILLISNLFTSLIGLDCSLHSIDLKCGIHSKWEELWESSNHQEWRKVLQEHNYVIDSKFSLVELSNGNDSYTNCLNYLTLNNFILNDDEHLNKKFQMKTMLSLLMSIHEKIYLERRVLSSESNGVIAATKWRMNSRPVIESLIKSWESLYIKNGGVFYLNEASLSVIYNQNPIMRLILPLLSFAKIRKCISLTPIIEKIWKKDWHGMNLKSQSLRDDPEALKDSTNYALDIVKLWIDYVSIHKNAEKTSIRTPVFFITCIFSSLLIISEFLLSLETWAQNYDENNPVYLNAIERTLWLRSEIIFKKIEECLVLNDNNTTYSEFLRLEAKGALDVPIIDDETAKRAVNPNTDVDETIQVIKNARLSSRSLYLGVRILADAPIWPIAMLFAQALKARAIHISKSQPNSPADVQV